MSQSPSRSSLPCRTLVVALLTLTGVAAADGPVPEWTPVHVEETFLGPGVSSFCQWHDSDGPGLYIGGEFYHMNGAASSSLVRFDGSRYTSVGGGVTVDFSGSSFPGRVECMAVWDPDGLGPQPSMLVVGGKFTHGGVSGVNGRFSPNIIGWDGTEWIPFADGLGFADVGETAQVRDLIVFDSGSGPQLYACGRFRLADGRKNIARWTGSEWVSVGSALSSGGLIYDLHVHDDGSGAKLYACGLAPALQDMAGHPTIGRWTGEAWEAVGAGPASTLNIGALASFDPDGLGPAPSLLCAGGRTTGSNDSILSAWNGVSWSNQPIPVEADEPAAYYDGISDLAEYNDGSGSGLYLAMSTGYIIEPGVASHTYAVKRWNGTIFTNESATRTDYAADGIYVFAERALGISVLAGQSRLWLGQPSDQNDMHRRSCLVRSAGSWGPSIASQGSEGRAMDAVMWDPDGSGSAPAALFCAGVFPWGAAATFDGVEFHPLPTLQGPGVACEVFDDGTGPALYVAVTLNAEQIQLGTGTTVYKLVGNTWQPVGGVNAFYEDNFFSPGTRADRIHDMLVFNDGSGEKLYAAGRFTTVNGLICNNIARWDGTSWQPVDPSSGANTGLYAVIGEPGQPGYADDQVYRMLTHDDGSGPALYVNGRFTKAGGGTARSIARWNGTTWSAVGNTLPEFYVTTPTLIKHDHGLGPVLFAGGFDNESSTEDNSRIWMWDGVSWMEASDGLLSGVDREVDLIGSFDVGDGRKLYAAGANYGLSTLARRYYVYSGGAWAPIADSFFLESLGGPAFEFSTSRGSGVLINAGWAHGGVPAPGLSVNASPGSRSGMVVWGCLVEACPADFDESGAVDVPDIFAFLAAWFAQGQGADFDNDGIIAVPDIFAFLTAWFAGCPA